MPRQALLSLLEYMFIHCPVSFMVSCYSTHTRCGPSDSCSACHQQKIVEDRIQALKDQIKEAEAEKLEIRKAINENHDPFQRLPIEVVSRIFEAGYAYDTGTFLDESLSPPFILGKVCRLWRTIAWSTPTIWTSISFCINPFDLEDALPDRLDLLTDYIKRSGVLPLSIQVYVNEEYEFDQDEDDIEDLVFILRLYIRRWHTIDIQLPVDFIPSFAWYCKSPSILTALRMSVIEDDGATPRCDITHLTKSLQYLDLSESQYGLDTLLIDSSNLIRVNASASLTAFLRLLSNAPRLEEATMIGIRDQPLQSQVVPGVVTHSTLKSLDITLSGMPDLLHRAVFSNLTSLTLWGLRSFDVAELLAFLGNQGLSLRVLGLHNFTSDNRQLKDIFLAFPLLEDLSIVDAKRVESNELLNELIFPRSSAATPLLVSNTESEDRQQVVLLPNLVKFSFNGIWRHTSSWRFLNHIQCGSPSSTKDGANITHPRSKLKDIRFHFDHIDRDQYDPFLGQEHLAIVKDLLEAGVKITISASGSMISCLGQLFIPDMVEYSARELRRRQTKAAWAKIFEKRHLRDRQITA